MKQILGSLLLLFTLLRGGSITASVDAKELFEGDTVLLTLTVVGENIDYIPDIEEIGGVKVDSIQRRTGHDMVDINGVTTMQKSQTIILEFKPKKSMTIPSFSARVDGELKNTKPIDIKIIHSSGIQRANGNFSLTIKTSKNQFYLGESIVLNVYFKQRTNIDITQIEYTPPSFKDFFSKQLGEGKTYKKGRFTIQELNYLLIAKKAGDLTLEPARIKVAQRSRQRQEGGWYVDVPKWTKLSSLPLHLKVIEPNVQHDIVGDYHLRTKIDHQKVEANTPVTLQVELVGSGTLDEYDGFEFNIPSVTIYSDDAKVESTLLGSELQSRYQKSFVFIADHNFTIPSKEIRLYNYKTGELKSLKTKSYHIEVKESKESLLEKGVHIKQSEKNISSVSSNLKISTFPIILALALSFLLGVVVTLFFKYLLKSSLIPWKKKALSLRGDEALQILYPQISKSKEVEMMVRQLYAIKHGVKGVKIDKKRLKELVEKYRDRRV